jgi:hypothetical protein
VDPRAGLDDVKRIENRVPRRKFGNKRDEITGGWRKLHKEELHDMYYSPSIIRTIMSSKMRSAGHVARMGRKGMDIGVLWESQKERYHREDLDVGGRTILKLILEILRWHGLD